MVDVTLVWAVDTKEMYGAVLCVQNELDDAVGVQDEVSVERQNGGREHDAHTRALVRGVAAEVELVASGSV